MVLLSLELFSTPVSTVFSTSSLVLFSGKNCGNYSVGQSKPEPEPNPEPEPEPEPDPEPDP